jgi:hypothetical protein
MNRLEYKLLFQEMEKKAKLKKETQLKIMKREIFSALLICKRQDRLVAI